MASKSKSKSKSKAQAPKAAARFAERCWIGSKAPKAGKGKSGLNLEAFCSLLLEENAESDSPKSDAALSKIMAREFPDFERSDAEKGPRFIRGLRSNLNRGGLRAQKAGNQRKPAQPIPEFKAPSKQARRKAEASSKAQAESKQARRSIGSKQAEAEAEAEAQAG